MDKKSRRKQERQERLRLLHEETRIRAQYCIVCPFSSDYERNVCGTCPIYFQLKDVGEQINGISNSRFTPPETLTFKTYLLLLERGWNKKQMAEHYGYSKNEFDEFLHPHQLKLAPETIAKKKGVKQEVHSLPEVLAALTVIEYRKLFDEHKTEAAICRLLGVSAYQMGKWKKAHEIITPKRTKVQKQQKSPEITQKSIVVEPKVNAEKGRVSMTVKELLADPNQETKESQLQKRIKDLLDEIQLLKDSAIKSDDERLKRELIFMTQNEELEAHNSYLQKDIKEQAASAKSKIEELELKNKELYEMNVILAKQLDEMQPAGASTNDIVFEEMLLAKLLESRRQLISIRDGNKAV